MRIALIRKKYTPHGGAERYLQTLISGLIKAGHEVHLFAQSWERQPGIIFHKVPLIKGLSFLKVTSFALSVDNMLKREKFDLVHSLERTFRQDIYRAGDGVHKEWLIRRKIFDPWWKTLFNQINPLHISLLYIEKRLFSYPNTKLIIANSQRGKDEIIKHYNYPKDRIKVVYNGVDAGRFNPGIRENFRALTREKYNISPQDYAILWVGSGYERKGMDVLLGSLDLIEQRGLQNWRLLVVGKGKINKYSKRIQGKSWRDKVIFAGAQKDVLPFYAAGDVFALPTVYEPFANVCLEALACGLPVITTATNGAAEILNSSCGSILEDPSDEKRLAEYLFNWHDKSLRDKAFIECGKLAEKFPAGRNVEETLKIYQEIRFPISSPLRGGLR